MKGMEIFDYIFPLILFMFLMGFYIWYIGCLPFGVSEVVDWLDKAYRLFIGALSPLRLGTYLQPWAEARAVVGTDGTMPTSSTDGGDASPSTQSTPPQPSTAPQPFTAIPQPEVVAATHDCATASDHRHLGCVESS